MKYICEKCQKEYEEKLERCPCCGEKLKVELADREQEQLQKQNDDFTVINTMML